MPRADHGIDLDGAAGVAYLSAGCGYPKHWAIVADHARFTRMPRTAGLHDDLRRCTCGLVLREFGLATASDDTAEHIVLRTGTDGREVDELPEDWDDDERPDHQPPSAFVGGR